MRWIIIESLLFILLIFIWFDHCFIYFDLIKGFRRCNSKMLKVHVIQCLWWSNNPFFWWDNHILVVVIARWNWIEDVYSIETIFNLYITFVWFALINLGIIIAFIFKHFDFYVILLQHLRDLREYNIFVCLDEFAIHTSQQCLRAILFEVKSNKPKIIIIPFEDRMQ